MFPKHRSQNQGVIGSPWRPPACVPPAHTYLESGDLCLRTLASKRHAQELTQEPEKEHTQLPAHEVSLRTFQFIKKLTYAYIREPSLQPTQEYAQDRSRRRRHRRDLLQVAWLAPSRG